LALTLRTTYCFFYSFVVRSKEGKMVLKEFEFYNGILEKNRALYPNRFAHF